MNNFLLNIIAALNKGKSKKQIQSDLKEMGDIKFASIIGRLVKSKTKSQIKKDLKEIGDLEQSLVGKLNKSKTKSQVKKDVKEIDSTITLTTKIDSKKFKKEIDSSIKTKTIDVDFNVKKEKLVNDLKILAQQNSKLFKNSELSLKYNSLLDSANLASSSEELMSLKTQLSAFRSELKATGAAGKTLGDTMKDAFKRTATYFSSFGFMMQISQSLKYAWNSAVNLNKSFTDLIKVQDELSRSDFQNYFSKITKEAKALATTQNELIDATAEFSKSGYDLSTSSKLSEKSTVLSNVGEMSATDSAKAITSGVQAWDKINGQTDIIEKATLLIDKYNAVGNTASITSEEIAKGVQSVGSVFSDANTSVDEFISLLAAGNRQFQDANTLALGLRTSALRIRAASAELSDLGEETDGVVTSIAEAQKAIQALTNVNGSGGVNILEADGETFRSIYDIYLDISKVYQSMSDTNQSSLLDIIAGTHRSSEISAVLNNMSEAQEILNTSLNSAGSAQKEYDTYLQGTEASINRFKATAIETYNNVLNGETVKNITDLGSSTLDFANSLGLVESGLKGLILTGAIKGIIALTTAFKSSMTSINNFSTALETLKKMSSMDKGTKVYAEAMSTLKSSSIGLKESQLKLVLSNQLLSESERIAILRTSGLTKAQAEAKLMQMGLSQTTKATTAANTAATASTFSLSGAVQGLGLSLKAAFLSNPVTIAIMALTTVIGAVSTSIAKYNQKVEETRQANIDASNTASESAKTLSNLYLQYEKLNSIQNRTSSQEEEYKDVIEDITTSLGNKSAILKDLTTGTDEYANALKEATKAELASQYSTAKIGAKAAENTLNEDSYSNWSGSKVSIQMNENMTGIEEHIAAIDEVRSILSQFEKYTFQGSKWEPSDVKNAKSVVEYYNALLEAREKISTSENADELMSSDIYKDINTTINSLSESVETYTKQEYEALKLNYLWKNGIPTTKEEFDKMTQSILSAAYAGEYFNNSIKDYLSKDYSDFGINADNSATRACEKNSVNLK